jgi:prevent-host-death family protein
MQQVGVREARERIGQLLNAALAGEEVVILRHGKPTARLVPIETGESSGIHFPDRGDFRAQFPSARLSSADLIRILRDERG